jgi:adenine/guanine phosphoribosyltransferase-like PRPP-binding protein
MHAFGQTTPSIPSVPKPEIPGYITQEMHQTVLKSHQDAYNELYEMGIKVIVGAGVGGLLMGGLIGYAVGKR